MLVEDHEDSRELLAQALQNAGAAVAAFGGAAEAFAALDDVRPSVIVADIGLPGEDGYSFIRRVRAHAVADDPVECRPLRSPRTPRCRIARKRWPSVFSNIWRNRSIPIISWK